jgi:chemotaxis protein methyltransferase CheR
MTTSTLSPDAISFVCTMVRERSAIELEESKAYLIEARLMPLAKRHGFTTADEFINGVRTKRQPDVERCLVEAMTTNETSFYRDIHPFNALRLTILPELRSRCAPQRSLNIWSAACSSGQELYSIAILIREHFPDLASWKLQLVGTDLSENILERARSGKFSQVEMNRGLPAPLLLKYFERDGMTWQLRSELRAMTKFTKLNLIEQWPALPHMDVVFLRNVLIYFSPDTKRRILQKVRQTMAPHGVLFLGAAETTMGLDSSFQRVEADRSVFYRIV